MKLSVIIPAYNNAELLPRCLDSICRQTYKKLEIIVINDGSKDETAEVIKKYQLKDERIRAINQKNEGLVSVREKGIELSKGEFVGFVDSDDEIEEDMYERLIDNALECNADISQCGIMYCFLDGRRKPMHGTREKKVYNTYEGVKELLKGDLFEPSLCNKIYKKEILINSCLDKTIINNEDLLRNFVLFSRAQRSVFEDFCGYKYWRREDSMSNNEQAANNWKNIIKARKVILSNSEAVYFQEAKALLLKAYINGYNSTLGLKEKDSAIFNRHCKYEIKSNRAYLNLLDLKRRKVAYMILYLPIGYKTIYSIKQRVNAYRRMKIAKKT